MKSERFTDTAGPDRSATEVAAIRQPHKRQRAAPTIDIVAGSPLWQAEPDSETILRRAVAAAAAAVSQANGELAIVLTDDSSIRRLNRDWRGKDEATNVLSFPVPAASSRDTVTMLLGDIVIAFETTAREAAAENKPFGHHLAHLAVHGFLHLVGYDHETDQEADAMENLETLVLAGLGVPNPYGPAEANVRER